MSDYNTPNMPVGGASTGQQAQIQQIRQTVIAQVAGLKQQIQAIQQQALQNMLNDIDSVFTAQLTSSLQQIASQQQNAQSVQPVPLAPFVPQAAPATNFSQQINPPYAYQQPLDVGQQATNIAHANADDAMKSAMQSVQNADNGLNNSSGISGQPSY